MTVGEAPTDFCATSPTSAFPFGKNAAEPTRILRLAGTESGSISSFAGIRAVTRKNKYIAANQARARSRAIPLGGRQKSANNQFASSVAAPASFVTIAGQRSLRKTIENEMRYEQVVVMFGRSPRRDVLMENRTRLVRPGNSRSMRSRASCSIRRLASRQSTSTPGWSRNNSQRNLPFPSPTISARRGAAISPRQATRQRWRSSTKGDPLQRLIPGRERVEAHVVPGRDSALRCPRTPQHGVPTAQNPT